ncbi:MAG TPA: HEAT repeat domain-containing protein [Candidatus Acidoferrum sp.]
MRAMILIPAILIATVFSAERTVAQTDDSPQVENARVEKKALAGPLAAEVKAWAAKAEQPQWLGYAVPQMGRDRAMCCGDYDGSWRNGCGHCRLEDHGSGTNMTSKEERGTTKLEAPRSIAVLLRANHKQITKIRVVSMDCSLDAGGLPFMWLSGVKPAESVALLETFVKGSDLEAHDDDHVSHGALTAIALHADPAADRELESFTRLNEPESLRKQTAFWLGAAREKAGLAVLEKMAKSDPSPEVRAQVTFALSVSHEQGAVEEMIRMAHDDQSPHVRGQALFWLAQKAGQKAVGAITGAIENDPDTDVKKKAVFALSQLPKDEGVPKLIEVAQTNRNREVRKQAMFWLGQSHDPRALAFFEKILSQ